MDTCRRRPDAQRLTESKSAQQAGSWRPDGKILAFHQQNPNTNSDIMTLPIEGDEKSGWKPGEPKPFVNTAFSEVQPVFSPDGRWLAYSSNESGDYDLYVRPFPGPGGKWQVSSGGGNYPKWSRNGKELFYRTGTARSWWSPTPLPATPSMPTSLGSGRPVSSPPRVRL